MPQKLFNTKSLLLVFCVLIAAGLFLLRPDWKIAGDGHGYYVYVRSLYFDNDFNFYNELLRYDKLYGHNLVTHAWTQTGKISNPFAIGWSIFLSPFFLIARGFDVIGGATHNGLPGFSAIYQLFLGFGSVFYAIIGAVFLFDALKRLFSASTAWFSTVFVMICSPLLHYIIYEPLMSHNLSFFAGCVLFWYAIKIWQSEKVSWREVLALGIVGGAVILIRWEHAIFLLLPFYFLFKKLPGSKLSKLATIIAFISIVITLCVPQFLMWHYLYGNYFLVPQGDQFISLLSTHFWSVLFSSYHGLFSWHPLLFFGLVGVFMAVKKFRGLAIVLLTIFILETYLHGALKDWWGGSAFGARKMLGILFVFAFGLAYLFTILKRRWRVVLVSLCAIFAIWNFLLMTAAPKGIISISKRVSFAELYTAPIKNALLILK